MRKKLLQNTLFAAMAAWALYLGGAHAGANPDRMVAMATYGELR